ncbi:N-acetylmuramoyl-L-alanine amidase [Thalassotalea sediminis]|uniref:N-acetylmuramoyl-L-alanine amidase n=1 Tax=Thalassotalea sediminis TaxID=1759089 RepID=UPI00257286D6|nr:peptidoglycan recognition family protein [Thalassotalea sediminis]
MLLSVRNICTTLSLLWLMACSSSVEQQAAKKNESAALEVVQWPIIYNDKREQLSLEYLDKRYGIKAEKAHITPKMVVVHWTAIPTLKASFNAFNSPMLPSARSKISSASQLNVSAHYLIDRDGTIYQLLPNTTFARHVIGLNHSAIGIENVGNGSTLPLTSEQLKANIALIKQLSEEFPIDYVIGHYEYKNFANHPLWKEVNPNYLTTKTDPGETFINQIRASLTNLNLKKVPDLPQ